MKPYTYEFKTFAKRRWIGKRLIDVFKSEFRAYSADYYADAIHEGRITVRDKKVGLDYMIKDNDKILHKTLRRETPVLATIPEILFEDERLIALDKPSSVPVHACGNFKYNTL